MVRPTGGGSNPHTLDMVQESLHVIFRMLGKLASARSLVGLDLSQIMSFQEVPNF